MDAPFPFWIFFILILFAARARQLRQEEEEETLAPPERRADLEFKIVRSNWFRFRKPGELQTMLAQEAAAGWRFYEKLDDARVRLARPLESRFRDATLGFDPYRTTYGMSQWGAVWIVVLVTLASIVLVLGVLFLSIEVGR